MPELWQLFGKGMLNTRHTWARLAITKTTILLTICAKIYKRWNWFTFCFIPIIPFSLKPYHDVGCHICNFYQGIKRDTRAHVEAISNNNKNNMMIIIMMTIIDHIDLT